MCYPNDSPVALQDLRWPDELKARLARLTLAHVQQGSESARRLIFHFYGPNGTGKLSLAGSLCSEIGLPLLVVDVTEIVHRTQSFEDAVCRILREAVFSPAAIYIKGLDNLLGDEARASNYVRSLDRWTGAFSWLTFIGTEQTWEPAGLFQNDYFISLELPSPDMAHREKLWAALSPEYGAYSPEVNWCDLATKFQLTPGQIRNALLTARGVARLRAGESALINMDDLRKGCRGQSNRKLGTLSAKLKPAYTWSDITLPPNALAQLREICAQVKHRRTVYEDWGFGNAHSLGKGLCALLYGPSGTGKTMAVEIIANELSLEAFKIDPFYSCQQVYR